jgi:hypothetical protein
MEVTMPGKRLLSWRMISDSDFRGGSPSEEGFEVIEAANGEEAVQTLERLDRLDLVLTDIQMPGLLL